MSVPLHTALAEKLLQARDLPGAFAAWHLAEQDGEDADRIAGGRWQAHMLQGEFAPAWQQSDAIRARGAPDAHRFWQGEEWRNRRVIVRCLHGFGDAVQYFQFLPRLGGVAAEVTVETAPQFAELARHFHSATRVVQWGEPAEWDVQVEVTELPYLFRVTLDDLPVATQYLRVPALEMQPRSHARPRVGIVWAGGKWNTSRSLPLEDLQHMLAGQKCEFWNLQGSDERAQWLSLPSAVRCGSRQCGDGMLALAQTIRAMDLVITTDTLAAHLAGALGVPCWVLLLHAADWRWMLHRDDSPWYPSLRLFRQPAPGDWPTVAARVAQELRAFSAGLAP